MKVVTVIPAYNEEEHVGEVVGGALEHSNLVIVVDDGSTDKTALVARNWGAKVLKLSRNKGKGYAMRVGLSHALDRGAEVLVFMDADGQHRPEDIPKFLEKLESADIVFGQRVGDDMPAFKKVGNWGLQQLFDLLFGQSIRDTQCGFKIMTAEAAKKIMWESDDYFFDTELAAKASASDLNLAKLEIPTVYINPQKGTTVLDGIRIAWNMLHLRVKMWLSE